MSDLLVLSFKDKVPEGYIVINTTSRSKTWSKSLSPFFIGNSGITLYNNYTAKNIENAWQYSKLYEEHTDEDGNPTNEYYEWAKKGWNSSYANRYPMGKGAVPICSLWNGSRLNYIEARKVIYAPLYAREVVKTIAYKKLRALYRMYPKIALLDFDGYNYLELNMTLDDVMNDPTRKMGHAFVLAMLLKGEYVWKKNN